MVGVLVIGVIGGIISVAVFAVIPWAQNEAAKGSLNAVRTAESVSVVQTDRFADLSTLVSNELLPAAESLAIGTDDSGSCYVAAMRSDSGKIFFAHDRSPAIEVFEAGVSEVAHCAGLDDVVAAIDEPTEQPAPPAALDPTAERFAAAQSAYFESNGRYAADAAELGFTANPGDAIVSASHTPRTLTNSVSDGTFLATVVGRFRVPGVNQPTTTAYATGGPSGGPYLSLAHPTGVKGLNWEVKLDGSSPNIIPVTPGMDYTASLEIRSFENQSTKLRAYFIDAAGATIGTAVDIGTAKATGPDKFERVGGILPASAIPGGAVKIALAFPLYNNSNTGPAGHVDIANATVVRGAYASAAAGSTTYDLPWFQTREVDYIAIVRTADGKVTAVTAANPAGAALPADALVTDGNIYVAGPGFSASLPQWAKASGWNAEISWTALRSSSWAPATK